MDPKRSFLLLFCHCCLWFYFNFRHNVLCIMCVYSHSSWWNRCSPTITCRDLSIWQLFDMQDTWNSNDLTYLPSLCVSSSMYTWNYSMLCYFLRPYLLINHASHNKTIFVSVIVVVLDTFVWLMDPFCIDEYSCETCTLNIKCGAHTHTHRQRWSSFISKLYSIVCANDVTLNWIWCVIGHIEHF